MPMPRRRSLLFRVLWGLVMAIGVAIGAALLVGSQLPVAHVATRSITVPAPPESVYATITDVASYPAWRPDVRNVVLHDDAGARRFTEESSSGSLTMVVEEAIPPSRLVTRIVGEGLPFGGAWAYAVELEGAGSRVTITEHGEVHNFLFRFVSRFVMGHASTLEGYQRALGRRYGVEVEPVDALPVPP
jgi:uncharacterized protein YndB with AHSA1/START domain